MQHRVIALILLGLFAAGTCYAQKAKRETLPTIGTIRSDEPATHIEGGCDNHYIVRRKGDSKYVFMSAVEGFQAFMNFNGHNVELRQVKTTLDYLDAPYFARAVYEYAWKDVRVTVRMTAQSDYTTYVPASITVRRGRTQRVIKGFIDPQCDAL